MLLQTKKHNRQLGPYTHNNSLLIQFILSEFVKTYQLASYVLKNLETQTVQSLYHCFNQLFGSHFSASDWTKGPLAKLNHYCRQFYKNGDVEDKNHLALKNCVHKAWLLALHSYELLNTTLRDETPALTFSELKRALKQLNTSIKQVAKSLSVVVHSFGQDENVIFFLFRKRKELEEIYGTGFIDKVFKMSATDIFQLLMQRYVKRGFDHLIPSMQYESTT